jgi:CHAT domain-containing protein/tetratricopeptide (TPR) repeat protein
MNPSRKWKAHRQFFGGLVALAILSATAGRAADTKAILPPEFLTRLEAAKTQTEQDEVIRTAGFPLSGATLREELRTRAYELTLAGDYLRAASDDDLLLRLGQEAGVEEDVAAARLQMSYILRESGDLAGALSAIQQAVDFYEAHPKFDRGLVRAHQVSGIIRLMQSDFAGALQSLHRALDLSQQLKWRDGTIAALNSIGEVYRTQGQPERALEYYARARETVGDDHAWNMAFIFNNIGMSYDALGDLDRAVENIGRARAVAEKSKMPPRVENSLAVLGEMELKRGELGKARENYAASLKIARELRDVGGQAQAILGNAQVAFAAGDPGLALQQAREAVALSRQIAQLDRLVPALNLSGRCLRALQRDEEASAAFRDAIAAVEEMRDRVAGGDVEWENFFAQQIEPYHQMVSLLVRQGKPEEALAMAERASARVLLDIISAGRTEMATVLTESERKTERDLDLKLADAQRKLTRLRTATKRDEPASAQDKAALHEARSARDNFQALVQAAHPELRRTALPDPLRSLAEASSLLEAGKNALLRFVVTDEESFLFLLTRSGAGREPQLRAISLGKDRAALARLTSDLRIRLASRSLAWEKPARELYDLLLRPVEKELAAIESLVIVPDGPLWELPFQTLESGADHPLLLDRAVRYAPSLTLLARLQRAVPGARPEHELLAFVNPALGEAQAKSEITKVALMSDNWQSLPQTEAQVPELEKIYPPPGGEVFVGADARECVFKEKAGTAGILHFAMHGVLDDRAPLYSYLLFSQVNVAPEEDGRLETHELMRLKLRARLAILCGCETARGEVTAGEGMIGLSWGFMVAGCPATIVSQWKVDSASSTPLMVELHRQLHGGADNAEALRRASLELRKDARYRYPFYWAPFVLVGAGG